MEQESALAIIETFVGIELIKPGMELAEIFKPGALDDVLAKIEAKVRSTPKDISTPKGREAVKSLAYNVSRSKTAIEDARIAVVEVDTKRISRINAEGKKMRDRLDALKIEARAPLTAWENEDKERCAKHEENISAMELAGTLDFGATGATIKERLAVVSLVDLTLFQEFKERATQTKMAVLSGLETKLKIAEKQAADALEMAKLRQESEERAKRDREAQIAQEAREKAQREAEAERQRIEGEKFAAEARAKQAEAEKAQAIEKAKQDAVEAQERAKQAAVDAARETKESEARWAKAAAEREAAATQAEKARVAAEAKRIADETKAREKDKAHKAEVNSDALAAFVTAGLTQEMAKKAVTAIAKGLIPNVKISY
jgi:hypothetical protein